VFFYRELTIDVLYGLGKDWVMRDLQWFL